MARRRRSRMVFGASAALLVFVLAAVFALPRLSAQEEPVARLQAPALEAKLDPPDAGRAAAEPSEEPEARRSKPPEPEPPKPSKPAPDAGSLRARLAGIAADYPATYGVMVSGPGLKRTVSINRDMTFSAASVGKLPVLLALYKSAARGEVDLDDPITMQASDVQAYGTGVLYEYPVGHTVTLRGCAKLLIKESDNTAWKMLTRYVGRDSVQAELYNIGATSTGYWIPNTTTPEDVLLMLRKISDPSYTSQKLSDEMLGFMTDTSFEDRLPAPLPEGARVAHKIGYYGDTFSDAGVVFPEGARRRKDAYFVVVMATDTTDGTSREATQKISLATYKTFSGSSGSDRPKRGPSHTGD